MKLYNKPELNVEKFAVEDIITDGSVPTINDSNYEELQAAGMEFDITADGNEF